MAEPITFTEKYPFEQGFAAHFDEYVRESLEEIEKRRKHYLGRFKLMAPLSAMLLLASPLLIYGLLSEVESLGMTYFEWGQGFSTGEAIFVSVTLFAVFVFLAGKMALGPIFAYRRKLQGFRTNASLKDLIFDDLFSFFGEYEFTPQGGISAYDVRPSRILPEYEDYHTEDWVKGTEDGVKVELCECILTGRDEAGKRVANFKGLLILLDVVEADIRLGKPFDGHTVVIHDQAKNNEDAAQRFQGLHRMNLATPELEAMLEAFTDKEEEARQVLRVQLMQAMNQLAEMLAHTREQKTHLDLRYHAFYFKLATLVERGFENLVFFMRQLFGKKYPKHLDGPGVSAGETLQFEHDIPLAHGWPAINDSIQCAFYKDKVLMTIPCASNLFEPNSLFEPALNEEDVHIILGAMHLVKEAVKTVNARG